MGDVVAVGDGEVFVTFFGFGEFGFDSFGKGRKEVGGFGASRDLLNLDGGTERAEEVGVYKDGIIKVDVVIVYRFRFGF